MTDPTKTTPIVIGKNGFAYADGVKIGKLIRDREVFQFHDPDRRRCLEKGREVVEVRLSDLINLSQQK